MSPKRCIKKSTTFTINASFGSNQPRFVKLVNNSFNEIMQDRLKHNRKTSGELLSNDRSASSVSSHDVVRLALV